MDVSEDDPNTIEIMSNGETTLVDLSEWIRTAEVGSTSTTPTATRRNSTDPPTGIARSTETNSAQGHRSSLSLRSVIPAHENTSMSNQRSTVRETESMPRTDRAQSSTSLPNASDACRFGRNLFYSFIPSRMLLNSNSAESDDEDTSSMGACKSVTPSNIDEPSSMDAQPPSSRNNVSFQRTLTEMWNGSGSSSSTSTTLNIDNQLMSESIHSIEDDSTQEGS